MGNKRRPIAVIDAESDPFKKNRFPEPFIWGFYDGVRYEEFTILDALPDELRNQAVKQGMQDVSEFIPFLEEQEIIVYAHNGGRFDYHFLLDYIDPFDAIMVIAGRLAKFKIGLCEFRDSFNILPVALDQWQKEKFDYTLLEKEVRYKPENWKKIRHYLHSDCINLFDMISQFQERYGHHLTQAGASMKYWQQMTGKKAPQSDADFYADFKAFYYGGRVECFKGGIIKEAIKLIDINSAYPYAMLHEHPFSLDYDTITDFNIHKDKIRGGDFFHIIAKSYGAFPFRAGDESLYFPADGLRREYHVTGWELQAALDTNTAEIEHVINCFSFIEQINFKDYILPLYNERLEAKAIGDTAGDLFNKLLMNSLYGKFAANPAEYGEYIVLDPQYVGLLDLYEEINIYDVEGVDFSSSDEYEQYIDNHPEQVKLLSKKKRIKRGAELQDDELYGYTFAGELGPWAVVRRDVYEDRQRFYNVATAASITGFVRAYLWRAICQCNGVVYCDTDSIFCREPGPLPMGKELGQWSEDGDFIEGAIAGKKLYAFKYRPGSEPDDKKTGKKKTYKTACKGGKLEASEIYRVARGETVKFTPEAPTYSVFKKPQFVSRDFRLTVKNRKI